MRCFFAIELPEDVRAEIGNWVRSVRAELPPARWVPPSNYHLTLVFLGELSRSRAGPLGARLGPVFGAAAKVTLRLGRPGSFPPNGRARVLWLGLDASPSLEPLVAELRSAAAPWLEQRREKRPYRPHLTVARCRKPWGKTASRRWASQVGEPPSSRIDVDRVVLMESVLRPRGAEYRVVEAFALGTG